jgi:hypothetical protein
MKNLYAMSAVCCKKHVIQSNASTVLSYYLKRVLITFQATCFGCHTEPSSGLYQMMLYTVVCLLRDRRSRRFFASIQLYITYSRYKLEDGSI